jgi:predicted nucleic acid-binding protein
MTLDHIFLDANILFSIAYGSPELNRLWNLARKRLCLLFASEYVIEEARRNLYNPDHLKKLDACLSAINVVPEADPEMPCPISLPEKDRPVLLAAISVKANYLITGDVLHFGKYFGKTVSGVKICRPRDYLQKFLNTLKQKNILR